MKTGKIIGIILMLGSLYLGYLGANKVADNSAEVEILGLEINASDESGKETGFIYIGFAVVLFAGGVFSLRKE